LIKKHHLAQRRSNGAAAPVPPARRDAISALRTRPQEVSSCDDRAFGEFAKRCRLIQWRRERLAEPLELGAPEIVVCNERRMLRAAIVALEEYSETHAVSDVRRAGSRRREIAQTGSESQ
jgi:hypothetical protein